MYQKNFYVYPMAQPFVLQVASRATDAININDRCDFWCNYITGFVCLTNTPATTLPYTVLMQISVNNIAFFNIPVIFDNIAGNGQNANYYPINLVFRKSARIVVEYQNLTASIKDIYLCFKGYELQPVSAPSGK